MVFRLMAHDETSPEPPNIHVNDIAVVVKIHIPYRLSDRHPPIPADDERVLTTMRGIRRARGADARTSWFRGRDGTYCPYFGNAWIIADRQVLRLIGMDILSSDATDQLQALAALRISARELLEASVVRMDRETTEDGTDQFYSDAEAVLAHLPRRGIAMILKAKPDGTTEPYTAMQMAKHVRKLRDKLGLPATFTLDGCRHGGMTELEEAELTDGQGRALSGHRTHRAYEGYAKRTIERALPAVRKRRAHALVNAALANVSSTSVQNDPRPGVQNIDRKERNEIA
jgi:hypothetical protein